MTQDKPVILVVEDEAPIRRFLKASLAVQGFKMVEAATGEEGLSLSASHHPDVILLDLGLPDLDGMVFLKRLREWSKIPVVILSARGQESDKVAALEAGADDYLTKPFGVAELSARLKVALRHNRRADLPVEPVLRSGILEVDLDKRRVVKGGQEIHLTPNEWDLLVILARYPGKLVTQAQLLKEVWGPAGGDNAHYLRTYMHQLRKKLEDNAAQPRWLLTEPGVGYRLRMEP